MTTPRTNYRLILTLSLALVLLAAGQVALAAYGVRSANTLIGIAQVNMANAARLVDCNVPSTPTVTHTCFDRVQQATIASLASISTDTRRTAIAAAACASNPATAPNVQACVDRMLPLKGPKP